MKSRHHLSYIHTTPHTVQIGINFIPIIRTIVAIKKEGERCCQKLKIHSCHVSLSCKNHQEVISLKYSVRWSGPRTLTQWNVLVDDPKCSYLLVDSFYKIPINTLEYYFCSFNVSFTKKTYQLFIPYYHLRITYPTEYEFGLFFLISEKFYVPFTITSQNHNPKFLTSNKMTFRKYRYVRRILHFLHIFVDNKYFTTEL